MFSDAHIYVWSWGRLGGRVFVQVRVDTKESIFRKRTEVTSGGFVPEEWSSLSLCVHIVWTVSCGLEYLSSLASCELLERLCELLYNWGWWRAAAWPLRGSQRPRLKQTNCLCFRLPDVHHVSINDKLERKLDNSLPEWVKCAYIVFIRYLLIVIIYLLDIYLKKLSSVRNSPSCQPVSWITQEAASLSALWRWIRNITCDFFHFVLFIIFPYPDKIRKTLLEVGSDSCVLFFRFKVNRSSHLI